MPDQMPPNSNLFFLVYSPSRFWWYLNFPPQYESSTFTNLNFKDYTEKLVAEILSSQQLNSGTIKTELDIEDIEMNMETAIPVV